MKTTVINLIGSPGTGKSTIAAELFAKEMLELVKIHCGDNYIELAAKQRETVDKIFEIYGDNK